MEQINVDQEKMKSDAKKGLLKNAISVVKSFSFYPFATKQSSKDAVDQVLESLQSEENKATCIRNALVIFQKQGNNEMIADYKKRN